MSGLESPGSRGETTVTSSQLVWQVQGEALWTVICRTGKASGAASAGQLEALLQHPGVSSWHKGAGNGFCSEVPLVPSRLMPTRTQ